MAGSGGGLSSPQVAGLTQFGELVPVIVFFVLSLQGSSARNVSQFSGPFGYGRLSVRGGPEFGVGIFGAQCSEAPGGSSAEGTSTWERGLVCRLRRKCMADKARPGHSRLPPLVR